MLSGSPRHGDKALAALIRGDGMSRGGTYSERSTRHWPISDRSSRWPNFPVGLWKRSDIVERDDGISDGAAQSARGNGEHAAEYRPKDRAARAGVCRAIEQATVQQRRGGGAQ